jgi:hypothetical protein
MNQMRGVRGALNAASERSDSMVLDEAAQVKAISRFLTTRGIREDFIKRGDAPLQTSQWGRTCG